MKTRRTRKTATTQLTPAQLGEQHGAQSALCSLTGEGSHPAFARFTREIDQRQYDWSRACAASRTEREFIMARELAR